jgi:F420-non-reducing hydrogenase small subunit
MKPKVAFYWCASCGGCEEAVVDLAEKVLDVVAAVDIVFWPVALDFKKHHVEAMEDKSITATFLNGAIRNSEQEEMAHLLRRKSQVLIAFGSCAQLGGIPGLANLWNRDTIFAEVFPEGRENGPALPVFFNTVQTLDQTVDVDYSIPGCPPTPNIIGQALTALLTGKLPPKGSVLAPDRALCEECSRRDTKPEKLAIEAFHRPSEVLIDETKCILAQGVPCLGSATRSGCGAQCVDGNMPCTGCFGPTSRVHDAGAKALSAIASMAASNDEAEIERILAGIPDPVGMFYRYSLPASSLRRKRGVGAGYIRPEEVA